MVPKKGKSPATVNTEYHSLTFSRKIHMARYVSAPFMALSFQLSCILCQNVILKTTRKKKIKQVVARKKISSSLTLLLSLRSR